MKTVRLLMIAVLLTGLFGAGNNALAQTPTDTSGDITASGTVQSAFDIAVDRNLLFGTLTTATDTTTTVFTIPNTPAGGCSTSGTGATCTGASQSGAFILLASPGNEVSFTSNTTSNESATPRDASTPPVIIGQECSGGTLPGTEAILFGVTYGTRDGIVGIVDTQTTVTQSGTTSPFTFTPLTGDTSIYVGAKVDIAGNADPNGTFSCAWNVTANNT